MTQLSQTPRQPHDNALRATVSLHRKKAVDIQGYVHGAAMYLWPSTIAMQIGA